MSLLDGTTPHKEITEDIREKFKENSFVSVPLNSDQLKDQILYLQDCLLNLPAEPCYIEARSIIRHNIGIMEEAIMSLERKKEGSLDEKVVKKKSVKTKACRDKELSNV